MTIVPIPVPPGLLDAKQVRYTQPVNGIIQFTDGSAEVFGITTGVPPLTFVATSNVGNVSPNPGDWLVNTRPALNTGDLTPGTPPNNANLQNPRPTKGPGYYAYYTNAQFVAQFQVAYGQAYAPAQGVVA